MNNYYFLTGKIGSGKTTFISRWSENKPGAAGIITITKNGKRFLRNVETNEERCFEVDTCFPGIAQKIGHYTFDNEAFLWAEEVINKTDFSRVKCFILDEAGILEMGMKGFYPAIQILLKKIKGHNTDIILVVRESLVDDMAKLFGLNNVTVYTKDNFKY